MPGLKPPRFETGVRRPVYFNDNMISKGISTAQLALQSED
jgi:hypothetical protein